MIINKIDCITFFQENFIFNIRFNILKNYFDKFIVCESKYDHLGRPKKLNFNKKIFNSKKIIYIIYNKKFPKNNNAWQNQALQRDYILSSIKFFKDEDYIFFSDPDEIPNPDILCKFELKKKYGIFMQDCFNYKFNLFNPQESPWEGTRVCRKKNLNSIDFMRQKIKKKNLNYPFWRIDKEKSIQIFKNGGWHFNNIMSAKSISKKLKSFAHVEFSSEKFSNEKIIQKKINQRLDLFERGYKYLKVNIDSKFPEYILRNRGLLKKWIQR